MKVFTKCVLHSTMVEPKRDEKEKVLIFLTDKVVYNSKTVISTFTKWLAAHLLQCFLNNSAIQVVNPPHNTCFQ